MFMETPALIPANLTRITVMQGQACVSDGPRVEFSTVLGSCVCSCLFDPMAGVGGMNHFLLAEPPHGTDRDDFDEHYGVYLMELLINDMLAHGAAKSRLRAHLYGGASLNPGLARIGARNAEFAHHFLAAERITALVRELFGRSVLITPNLDEASLLVGRTLASEADMKTAAQELLAKGAKAVLIKGGHLAGDVVSDLLQMAGAAPHWMRAPRIATANTHGTGCTLSSAIAAHLALGLSLVDAVEAARHYVRGALAAGASVKTGQGGGPLNHGFAPQPLRLRPLVA